MPMQMGISTNAAIGQLFDVSCAFVMNLHGDQSLT